MKKTYESPTIEIEEYTLDMSIASNCTVVVTNGPAMGEHAQCTDYVPEPDPEEGEFLASTYSVRPHNVNFYDEKTCDCYYSAGVNGYWTS